MPKNTEYLLAAYGITIGAIGFYFVYITLKLRSVTLKLNRLLDNKADESKEP